MAIGLRKHPGDKRELLGTDTHVEGAVGVGEEVRRPAPTEGLPRLRRKGVVLDAALLLTLLPATVIAEGAVVGGTGDGHLGMSLIHISEPTRLRRISYAV